MNSQYLQELVDTMRSIIAESLDVALSPFTDFMFVTSGIGLKSHFSLNEEPIDLSSILCDLNWSLIDLETTVVDVGFEHHHLDSSPMIGLWRTTGNQNTDSPFVHEELIRLFWGSDASLLKNNFGPDPFSNFRSLLGFQYKTSPRSTPALPGLKKMVAYHKVKQPFYSRSRGLSTHRFGMDYNVDTMWLNSDGFTSFQDHITTTCSIITNESYGARLELRMDGSSLVTRWGEIVEKAVDSAKFVHWESAENIAGLWLAYSRAIGTIVTYLQTDRLERYRSGALSLLAVACYIGSSLFSRPPHQNKWRHVSFLLRTPKCPSSDLLFLVDLLDTSNDERLLSKRPFSLDYLAMLFDSDTWVQISAGPRTGFIMPRTQLAPQSSSPTTATLFDSVSITDDLYNLCSNDEQATGLLRLVSFGVSLPVIKSFTDSLAVSIWNTIIKQDRNRKGAHQDRQETRFVISDDEQKELSFDNFFNNINEIFKASETVVNQGRRNPQYYIGQYVFHHPEFIKSQPLQFSMPLPYSTFPACNAYIITVRALLYQDRDSDAVRFYKELLLQWAGVKFLPWLESKKVSVVVKGKKLKLRSPFPS